MSFGPSSRKRNLPPLKARLAAIFILGCIAATIVGLTGYVTYSESSGILPPDQGQPIHPNYVNVQRYQRIAAAHESWQEDHPTLDLTINLAVGLGLICGVVYGARKLFTATGDELDEEGVWNRMIARRRNRFRLDGRRHRQHSR